jgi:hypothetical protein
MRSWGLLRRWGRRHGSWIHRRRWASWNNYSSYYSAYFAIRQFWHMETVVVVALVILAITLPTKSIIELGTFGLEPINAPTKTGDSSFRWPIQVSVVGSSPNICVPKTTGAILRENYWYAFRIAEGGGFNNLLWPQRTWTLDAPRRIVGSEVRRKFVMRKLICDHCCYVGSDGISDVFPFGFTQITQDELRPEFYWGYRHITENNRGALADNIVSFEFIKLLSEGSGLRLKFGQCESGDYCISGSHRCHYDSRGCLNVISSSEGEAYPMPKGSKDESQFPLLRQICGYVLLTIAVLFIAFAILCLNGGVAAIDGRDFVSARLLFLCTVILWGLGGCIMWNGFTMAFPTFFTHSDNVSASHRYYDVSALTYWPRGRYSQSSVQSVSHASSTLTISATSQSRFVTPEAIAGVTLSAS